MVKDKARADWREQKAKLEAELAKEKEALLRTKLPTYVEVCGICDGKGEYEQTYTAGCGGGYYRSSGPCWKCGKGEPWKGVGYVYKATGEPVPQSVLNQIADVLGKEIET